MDKVAVNVIAEPSSETLEAELVKVTVGALSFSLMVKVTVCVPFSVAEPPETVSTAIIPVSFPS